MAMLHLVFKVYAEQMALKKVTVVVADVETTGEDIIIGFPALRHLRFDF